MNYKPQDLKTQYAILSKAFKEVRGNKALEELASKPPGILPDGAEHFFLIPDWIKLAPTYPEAVQRVWEALEYTRKGAYKYVTIDASHLRQSTKLTTEIVAAQFGEKYKGYSIEGVRKETSLTTDRILLGAYEVGIMLLTHPDRITKYEDLWIDCPNDEYSWNGVGAFSRSVYFGFDGGGLKFGYRYLDIASGRYGSASAFGFGSQSDPGS